MKNNLLYQTYVDDFFFRFILRFAKFLTSLLANLSLEQRLTTLKNIDNSHN